MATTADALDGFPPRYAAWVRELLSGPVPAETGATCDQCAMIVPGDATAGFHPETKCCTYLPELHNFLVGAILDDDRPETAAGRATVRARIARGTAVSPLGLGRPSSYVLVYDQGGMAVFGRSRSLRCPHYLDDGRCGVWQHRESTCATWFCKYSRGGLGRGFWQAVWRLLALVERGISWWCVAELGLEPASVAKLCELHAGRRSRTARIDAADLDCRVCLDHDAMWGTWVGREDEFYQACARQAHALDWPDALALGGAEARVAALDVQRRFEGLSSEALPSTLTVAPFRIVTMRGNVSHVTAYSDYDVVELPTELVVLLARFDGRSVEVIRRELADEGIEIDTPLLIRLIDLGVLVPGRSQ